MVVVNFVGEGATGARLKKLRKKAGFKKPADLAMELGAMFSKEAIKEIEAGTASAGMYNLYLTEAMPIFNGRNSEAALEYTRETMFAGRARRAINSLRYE